eukprot:GHVR01080278.1.p1 GENE.GHVR01080278.1~~GHVR01080278.1.p1  ORF type:complete len:271 (+),score=61.01 GHVR01080278.1:31-843(+)
MDEVKSNDFQPVRRGKGSRMSSTPYKTASLDENIDMNDTDIRFETVELKTEDPVMVDDYQQDEIIEDDPTFPELSVKVQQEKNTNNIKGLLRMRRVAVPSHRLSPLRKNWLEVVQPLVDHLHLQVRMNTKRRCVEIKTSNETTDIGALQKAADFVRAFMLGFEVQDGIALLRLDDLFIESFEVKDVKRLQGDHLSRCIGRLSGKDGKTKYAIENATRTRIVVADSRIHILGSFQNIRFARGSVCSLIMGSPPGKVYNHLRTIGKRITERM